MALDQSKLIVDNSYFADGVSGTVIVDQLGVDDGNDFTAGTVIRSIDGSLTLATVRERNKYNVAVLRDEAKTKAQAANAPQGGLVAIREYLAAKFPEDFE